MRLLFAFFLIIGSILVSACGGAGSPQSIQPQTISVAVSPAAVNLIAGATQQFSATVTGSSNRTVTWSLNSPGCSGANCGTITSSGMYTAPSPIPTNIPVTVVATSVADSTKAASGTANLIPISVSISPSTGSVYQRDMMQFTASVAGTNNAGVTWDINGLIGGGCATGYIWPSGLYTTSYCDIYNPPQTFTIRATSNADNSKSATAHITVTDSAPNNASLSGDYALLYQGFDNQGPVALAGHFNADGAGGIIGGELALNSVSSTIVMSGSGNYSVGSDNRGTLYLGSWLFRFSVDSAGKMRIFDFDQILNNPIRGSGMIKKQDSTAFSLDAFNGSFALGLTGDLNGSAMALLGQFTSDNTGSALGTVDSFTPSAILANASMNGAISAPDLMSGAGTVELVPQGMGVNTPLEFEYFIVSPTEAFVVQIDTRRDNVPILSGVFRKQSGAPFNPTLMNSPTVLQLTGPTSGGSHAILAQAVFNGGGLLSGLTDDNRAGGVLANESFTGSYTVAPNGRGTATIFFSSGLGSTTFTYYLIGPTEAFVVGGTPASPVGEVVFGAMQPQTGGPYTAATIAGSYAVGTLAPATNSVPSATAAATLDASGNFSGMLDTCMVLACALSQPLSGTISITDAAAGRGTVTIGALSGASALYIVSPTKALMLNSLVTGDNAASIISFEQ